MKAPFPVEDCSRCGREVPAAFLTHCFRECSDPRQCDIWKGLPKMLSTGPVETPSGHTIGADYDAVLWTENGARRVVVISWSAGARRLLYQLPRHRRMLYAPVELMKWDDDIEMYTSGAGPFVCLYLDHFESLSDVPAPALASPPNSSTPYLWKSKRRIVKVGASFVPHEMAVLEMHRIEDESNASLIRRLALRGARSKRREDD